MISDLHDSEGNGIHEDKKLKEVVVDFFLQEIQGGWSFMYLGANPGH